MTATATVPDLGRADDLSPTAAAGRLRACADAGLLRHAIASRHGGHGDDFQGLIDAHARLGRQTRDPGLILAVNAHLWGAVFQLLRFGSEHQRQTWLPALLSAESIGGHAITEPQAGSDISALRSYARPTAGGFRLHGHKRYITNAPIADMLVVYVRDQAPNQEPARGQDQNQNPTGLSAYLVRRDDPGVEFRAGPVVKGCASATMGDVVLKDCELPGDRLLGSAGAGAIMIQLALEHERAFIFAGISGVMDWQLQQAQRHARARASAGGRLADRQAISHRIADMQLRSDTTRLWIRECARLLDQHRRITLASAETKLYAAEAFLQTSLDTAHILGASGLEGELPALVLDAMAGRLFSGSSEIQKNIIAAMLGLSGGK